MHDFGVDVRAANGQVIAYGGKANPVQFLMALDTLRRDQPLTPLPLFHSIP